MVSKRFYQWGPLRDCSSPLRRRGDDPRKWVNKMVESWWNHRILGLNHWLVTSYTPIKNPWTFHIISHDLRGFLKKTRGSIRNPDLGDFFGVRDSDPPPPWPQYGSIEFQNVFLRLPSWAAHSARAWTERDGVSLISGIDVPNSHCLVD